MYLIHFIVWQITVLKRITVPWILRFEKIPCKLKFSCGQNFSVVPRLAPVPLLHLNIASYFCIPLPTLTTIPSSNTTSSHCLVLLPKYGKQQAESNTQWGNLFRVVIVVSSNKTVTSLTAARIPLLPISHYAAGRPFPSCSSPVIVTRLSDVIVVCFPPEAPATTYSGAQ